MNRNLSSSSDMPQMKSLECYWRIHDYRYLMPIIAFDFLCYAVTCLWMFKYKMSRKDIGKISYMIYTVLAVYIVQLASAIIIFEYQIRVDMYDLPKYLNILDAIVVFCQQVLYVNFFKACFVMKGIELQIDINVQSP